MANKRIRLIPIPEALLAFRLRSRLGCQNQEGIGHRGDSATWQHNSAFSV